MNFFNKLFIWGGLLLFSLLVVRCSFSNSDVNPNKLTTNVPSDSIPLADMQTEKDLVDRRINDRIADIQQYMRKIDSASSLSAVELKTDLSSIKVELYQMLKNIQSDSLFKDSSSRKKLQMVEDELMQIGKEIDEVKYKEKESKS